MHAQTDQFEEATAADCATTLSRQEAQREDAFWRRNFWQERYYHDDFEYEDYAPAYCVGYAGCAQYGGDFRDAERCLLANWERIKGDSRLAVEQALPAIRAAWERLVRQRRRPLLAAVNDATFDLRRMRVPTPLRRTSPAAAGVGSAAL